MTTEILTVTIKVVVNKDDGDKAEDYVNAINVLLDKPLFIGTDIIYSWAHSIDIKLAKGK